MTSNWSSPDGPWRGEAIALVGMAGRFPMADSVEAFWQNLLDGRDCIARFSREELLADGVPPTSLERENFVPAGGVLDDIELFDAQFFGISPREAESMDPQQRLFLEVVQHALDDAGLDPARTPGPIAVYAGERLSGYWLKLMKSDAFMAKVGWHQVAAGNDKDFLPAQASFRFDLRGPSVNVQSACSTSLLAVSLACDALVTRRCDAAIAGAASVAVPQRTGYSHAPSSIASADGTCRPFDASASGSVLGNAVAAVVLKRLDDAVAAGDRIYAVIRSVAANNDGATKPSFAGPSVAQQAAVISRAMAEAGIAGDAVGYIEAHGTATTLGDPIEAAALARTIGAASGRETPCLIGSVKSNVGHLDPAAGAAALIKAALCLHRGEIPASLHYKAPNPAIDFVASKLRVAADRTPWPRGKTPRAAGVSAFGIGGTNVHAILGEAPETQRPETAQRPELVTLSAKTATALDAARTALVERLRAPDAPALTDAAFTLACGRRQFKHRLSVVAEAVEDAAERLGRAKAAAAGKPRVVFLYPGQGQQRIGMAGALYRQEPVFRVAMDEILELTSPGLGFDARGLIDPERFGNGHDRDVSHTALAQPLLFAVEVAAARLWADWGVVPDLQLGHSVGELAAAHLSGVMSLADAVRVVTERGRLMQSMPPGAMIAVALDEDAARAHAADGCEIAAYNGPAEHVLSGSLEDVDRLQARLEKDGVRHTRLGTSHAFHHRSMKGAAEALLETLSDIHLSPPERPFVSCVTGNEITPDEATNPKYWADSILLPVRFAAAARTLLSTPGSIYVECGAGGTLVGLLRAQGLAEGDVALQTAAGHGDRRSDQAIALDAAGRCWAAGVPVRLEAMWADGRGCKVSLPRYPFQRVRHWVEPTEAETAAAGAGTAVATNAYTRVWLPTAPPRPASALVSGTWLVLADRGQIGERLCARLRAGGARAIAIYRGHGSGEVRDDEATVAPNREDAIASLVPKLSLAPGRLEVVNTWTAVPAQGPLTPERIREGATLALRAPVTLLRALSAHGRGASGLVTVTAGLLPVAKGEPLDPVLSLALGPTRTLPQELKGFRARIVDVRPSDHAGPDRTADRILAELVGDAAEPLVAYRGETRLVESFAPLALPAATPHAVATPGATYLVTGGFGGLGGVFARTLAAVGNTNIVLLGRRGVPPADSPQGASAASLIRELEGMGSVVAPYAVDVTDTGAVARVVAEVGQRFGRISGVIHAAGLPGGRMLLAEGGGNEGTVLAPKTEGALALLSAVAPHNPDFVLLCSSFASVSGGMGQGEYAAANAFLDALALWARQGGLNTISVCWPAWRDVGMAHAMDLPPELQSLREASLRSGITPEEGADLFLRLVQAGAPHVVIAPRDVASAAQTAAAPAPAPALRKTDQSAVAPPPEPAVAARPVHDDATDEDLEAALRGRIAELWCDVLGVSDVTDDDDFFELGGQSLMGLQVVMRLSEMFETELGLSDIYETPTLGGFAGLMRRRLDEAIAMLPDDEVRRQLGPEAHP